jgi:hypothetical protein
VTTRGRWFCASGTGMWAALAVLLAPVAGAGAPAPGSAEATAVHAPPTVADVPCSADPAVHACCHSHGPVADSRAAAAAKLPGETADTPATHVPRPPAKPRKGILAALAPAVTGGPPLYLQFLRLRN